MTYLRRESRYRSQLQVKLFWKGATVACQTDDVSFGGFFLLTDVAPPVGQLVRLNVAIPGVSESLPMHGMVAHINPSAERQGIGIQFYGIGAENRARWVKFVNEVRSRAGDTGSTATTAEPVKRAPASGDYAAVLEIRPRNEAALLRMYARDISLNGMFIQTADKFEANDEVYLVVVHPTNGHLFGIRCIVRRHVRQSDIMGIGVEFTGLDQAQRRAFWDFIGHLEDIDQHSAKIVVNPDDMVYRRIHVVGP